MVAPSARTASTLICCVVRGMTIVARAPRCLAASATPCAWLPAEEAITPRVREAGLRRAILLYAPRHLNEKIGCMSSRFSHTRLPKRSESTGAYSSGVSRAISYTRASRIRLR
jgi:hypothetical protein